MTAFNVADDTNIHSLHFHIFYDASSWDRAQLLRVGIAARFPVEIGEWHDECEPPHTQPEYSVKCTREVFNDLLPWLMLNRLGLSVLAHPITDNPRKDHSENCVWLGAPIPIQVELLPTARLAPPEPVRVNSDPTDLFVRSERRQAKRRVPESSLTPHQEVAVMARTLCRNGFDSALAGHITRGLPNGAVLTNPNAVPWDQLRASDVCEIDEDVNIIAGTQPPNPGVRLHFPWRSRRPELLWTIHNHPHWATIWASAGRTPPLYNQMGAGLGEIALVQEYEVNDSAARLQEFAERVAESIGTADVALLGNHGVLIGGRNANEAVTRALGLEFRCRSAWHVAMLGGGAELTPAGREIFRSTYHRNQGLAGYWQALLQQTIDLDPDVLA